VLDQPALAAFAIAVCLAAGARAATPFDSLLGSWSGSGQIRYESGQPDAVKCTAYYTGGGQELRLAIRCSSSSNDIEIRGQLSQQADKVSGTWEERTYNASGTATGKMAGGRMTLSIEGGGFSGSMSVAFEASRQTVVITTEGIGMKSVNVTLGRS
jgi:hypothetical protein